MGSPELLASSFRCRQCVREATSTVCSTWSWDARTFWVPGSCGWRRRTQPQRKQFITPLSSKDSLRIIQWEFSNILVIFRPFSLSASAKPSRPRSQSASQASKPIILRRQQTQGTTQGIAPMNFSPSSSSGSAALSAMTGIPGNMLVVFCVIIIQRKIRCWRDFVVVIEWWVVVRIWCCLTFIRSTLS